MGSEPLGGRVCGCPLPAVTLPWGGSGQPLLTLAPLQRIRKATQPLNSWRAASGRDMSAEVINVPFTITLTSSDFTAQPDSST